MTVGGNRMQRRPDEGEERTKKQKTQQKGQDERKEMDGSGVGGRGDPFHLQDR